MNSHGNSGKNERDRDEKFLRDVLSRTSGSGCDRACEQLSELMDGTLVGMDRELVQAHLEHCDPCRSVAVTLGWLEPLLPQMAEIDPGPDFTARVLAKTSRRGVASPWEPAEPVGPAGVMDRIGRWWDHQILRPGFAAQVAYAATLVLVLLTAVPGAPFREVPVKALEIVQAGPTSAPVLGPAMNRASGWLGVRTDATVTAARTEFGKRLDEVGSSLADRRVRTAPGRREMGVHLKGLVNKVGDAKLGEASYEFLAVLKAGQSIWIEWWKDNDDDSTE